MNWGWLITLICVSMAWIALWLTVRGRNNGN